MLKATTRRPHNPSEEKVSLLLTTESNTRQRLTMATNKPFKSQRTFDSTDDLLENEEELDEEVQVATPSQHEGAAKPSSVWDCRAVNWPPHSVKSMVKSGYGYAKSPFLILEVLSLAVFLYLCYILPGECARFSFGYKKVAALTNISFPFNLSPLQTIWWQPITGPSQSKLPPLAKR